MKHGLVLLTVLILTAQNAIEPNIGSISPIDQKQEFESFPPGSLLILIGDNLGYDLPTPLNTKAQPGTAVDGTTRCSILLDDKPIDLLVLCLSKQANFFLSPDVPEGDHQIVFQRKDYKSGTIVIGESRPYKFKALPQAEPLALVSGKTQSLRLPAPVVMSGKSSVVIIVDGKPSEFPAQLVGDKLVQFTVPNDLKDGKVTIKAIVGGRIVGVYSGKKAKR